MPQSLFFTTSFYNIVWGFMLNLSKQENKEQHSGENATFLSIRHFHFSSVWACFESQFPYKCVPF